MEIEFTQPIEMRFNELISGTRSDIAVKSLVKIWMWHEKHVKLKLSIKLKGPPTLLLKNGRLTTNDCAL
jgi:hypothetical protein